MSPEQASGHPVDFRSDQFSFGSMLYEMAAGKPAFKRPTTAQTLASIIEDEPEPIGRAAPKTPAPLRWVIERCLSKEPKGRYASTEDLARELADLRDHISDLSSGSGVAIELARPRPRWRMLFLPSAVLAALAGMYFLGRRVQLARAPNPTFPQLTFRGAGIGRRASRRTARRSCSARRPRASRRSSSLCESTARRPVRWGCHPRTFSRSPRRARWRSFSLRPFALSPRIGHMAWEQLVHRDPSLLAGTLAQVPLVGGAPRELLEEVLFADWAPNGTDFAVVHRIGNRGRLEFPIGKTVSDDEEILLNHPRVSPKEPGLAFKDWAELRFARGSAPTRRLTANTSAWESAWHPRTGEIWYTDHTAGTEIHAITTAGRDRLVYSMPGDYILYDISTDGRVLLGRVSERAEIRGSFPGESGERNLSYFDSSEAVALASDNLFFNEGATVDGIGATYVRPTDGSAPKRLMAAGRAHAASADGAWILAWQWGTAGLFLVPAGPGLPRQIETPGVERTFLELDRLRFLPDGRGFVFTGKEAGHRPRIWVAGLNGEKPRAVTPEDVRRPVLLGDGRSVCARAADFDWYLYPIGSGQARKVLGLLPGEEPFDSTLDGRLYVRGADELRSGETLMTTRVYRLDPLNGRRELWKEIPPDRSGVGGAISSILFSADGKTCVWTHIRYSTELVLVEGLK